MGTDRRSRALWKTLPNLLVRKGFRCVRGDLFGPWVRCYGLYGERGRVKFFVRATWSYSWLTQRLDGQCDTGFTVHTHTQPRGRSLRRVVPFPDGDRWPLTEVGASNGAASEVVVGSEL